MFCSKCGNQLPEEANVCPMCGTAVNGRPVSGTTAASGVNPYLSKVMEITKKFFSKEPYAAVDMASQENIPCRILIEVVGLLLCGLAVFVNCKEMLGTYTDAIKAYVGRDILKYGLVFLYGCLTYAIGFAAVLGGIIVMLKALGKSRPVHCVANVIAVSSIPLMIAFVINMIVGVIYSGGISYIFITALLMSTILLFAGAQKLGEFIVLPYWAFSIVLFIICIVILIFTGIFGKSIAKNMLGYITNILGAF